MAERRFVVWDIGDNIAVEADTISEGWIGMANERSVNLEPIDVKRARWNFVTGNGRQVAKVNRGGDQTRLTTRSI